MLYALAHFFERQNAMGLGFGELDQFFPLLYKIWAETQDG